MRKILGLIFTLTLILLLSSCEPASKEYKVSFSVEGEVIHTLSTTGGEMITLPKAPEIECKAFVGWYYEGEVFDENSLVPIMLEEDISASAVFEDAHTVGEYKIDAYPTDVKAGTRHRLCAVCGSDIEGTSQKIFASKGFNYTNGYSGVTITGLKDIDDEEIIIPSHIYGTEVRAIESTGENVNAKSIILPPTLKTIEHGAFNLPNLTEITIPKSVTKIETFAFAYSDSLTRVVFEEGGTTLTIETEAFSHCVKLKEVVFSKSHEYIKLDSWAFNNCPLLLEIYLPLSIKEMGSYVFDSTKAINYLAEAEKRPELWSEFWLPEKHTVTWGVKP